MKKKSIFLVGAMMLIMGGELVSGVPKLLATNNLTTSENVSECSHEHIMYVSNGLVHNLECSSCRKNFSSEGHIDSDNNLYCDTCNAKLSATAPTIGEGSISSTFTSSESVKISIKANPEEVIAVMVSSWYENELEEKLDSESGDTTYEKPIYTREAIYNEETGMYEAIVNFADVNGEDGTYYFDAYIYGEGANMRYVRLSVVEYQRDAISNVTTNRQPDGSIEVTIDAIEGGEIYIATNGETPTEESNWTTYEAGETYTLQDEEDEVEEVSVYYRSNSNLMLLSAPRTAAVTSTEDSTAMVTQWTIPSANTTITLPVSGTGLNITVDWGDGTAVQTVTTELPTHTYTNSGVYYITIQGKCPVYGYNTTKSVSTSSPYYTHTQYLTGVRRWGELGATSYGFVGCSNLTYVLGEATSNTFSNVTTMKNMFAGCTSLNNIELNNFNTNNVTEMQNMFYNCISLESIDLGKFNTSSVTNFFAMFQGCSSLKNLDVSTFDFSNATNLSFLFTDCTALENLELGEVYPKTSCSALNMFKSCTSLKYLDLTEFYTQNMESLTGLFEVNTNLKSLLISNSFSAKDNYMFLSIPNLEKIIIVDETPVSGQFTNAKSELSNVIFYVPNENAETLYETSWQADFTIDKIEPIFKLLGEDEVEIGTYETYENVDYLIAGIDKENSGDYQIYGYDVTFSDNIDTTKVGTYDAKYTLKRNGVEVTSIIQKVNVIKYPLKPPSNFKASLLEYEKMIIISWKSHTDTSIKYELSVKNSEGNWEILSDNATSSYDHVELNPGEAYEYRIRAYSPTEYSEYAYTQGSTMINQIYADIVLDTRKPLIEYDSCGVPSNYTRPGISFDITFKASDENYTVDYNYISGDKIIVNVGTTKISSDNISVEKLPVPSGEKCKIIINEIPDVSDGQEIVVIIPEGTVLDKSLNPNETLTYNTGIIVYKSTITKDAPTVNVNLNTATLTCNQTTDIEPENAVIYYEYRESNKTEFIRAGSNIIDELNGETNYDFRTVLLDVTGNEVASDVTQVFVESLKPKVEIKVVSPDSGAYAAGTKVAIEAIFDKPVTIVDLPKLGIRFGNGVRKELTGTFDEINNLIRYEVDIEESDAGILIGTNFTGIVLTMDDQIVEFYSIPNLVGNTIEARNGVMREDAAGNISYSPYLQDAIDAVNEDSNREILKMLISEEITESIVIPENKKIALDLNGKDIISIGGDYTALTNRGEVWITEEIGTGEISAYVENNAKAIVNYGKMNLTQGMVSAKITNITGNAYAIYNYGILVLGKNDNDVKVETPVIDSDKYGIYNATGATFEFYDGVIKGERLKTYYGEIYTCDGYNIVTENIGNNREMTYLGVDRMPPTLNYEILTPGWRNDYVEVKITVYDDYSGINLLRVNNEEVSLTDSEAVVRFEENGEYPAYVEDNVGNSTTKIIKITTIDKDAPVIKSITMDEEISNTEVSVLVSVQDFKSGLAGLIIKDVDEMPTADEDWTLFEKYPTSRQVVPMVIKRGIENYCFAKDRAGNISKYEGEIIVDEIDKVAPVIQSAKIVKENGKDYIVGKGILLDVIATDNIAVTEILVADKSMSNTEAQLSNDWKTYTRYIIHELPVEGDKVYTVYIWVKDLAGNISLHATTSAELKALIIGDNENDYTGDDELYNKSRLRFRAKDWNYNYDKEINASDILLRLSSGDTVIRNVTTGLTLKKLNDYISSEGENNEYRGKEFELEMENIPGTGNLSLVLLGGAINDLARNAIDGVVKLTDIFIDNNAPKVRVQNTENYENGKQIRNITVIDGENNLIEAIETIYNGEKVTYTLTNGKINVALYDKTQIIAYDKAGNESNYIVGAAIDPILSAENYKVELVYGGASKNINYTYNGDGAIYIESSDTTIANASIDINTNKITILPVNAGDCEVTVRTIGTSSYTESKFSINVTVKQRPVVLEWDATTFTYDRIEKIVKANVQNTILDDIVNVTSYKNNMKVNAGSYVAEATEIDNANYTIEGGTNITHNWVINKADRTLILSEENINIRINADDNEDVKNPKVVTFSYTGDETDEVTATIVGTPIVDPVLKSAHGEGEISLVPLTIGKSVMEVNIPESTNYKAVSKSCDIRVTKMITIIFDADGGTPAFQTKIVEWDEPYGELPNNVTNGERGFNGWFTEREGQGTMITPDTKVTVTDNQVLYACWNRPPEFRSVTISSRSTTSLTISALATDPDEDTIRYRFYHNGNLVHTTDYVPQNVTQTFTVTGLSEDTRYSYKVIVDDRIEYVDSGTKYDYTNCSGTGYTDATYCSGTENKYGDCTECTDGTYTWYCSGGETNVSCRSCGGDGEETGSCSGPSPCSNCGGSGSNPCTSSPSMKSSSTSTCGSCGTGTLTTEAWGCDSCGVTGTVIYCTTWYDPDGDGTHQVPCTTSSTNNHPTCPKCGGADTSTCSHGKTSSHSYTESCSSCGGDGKRDYTCPHGNMNGHDQTDPCSCCGGDQKCYEYRPPCDEHNNYGSHYVCTSHRYDGSTQSHCGHGYNREHYAH